MGLKQQHIQRNALKYNHTTKSLKCSQPEKIYRSHLNLRLPHVTIWSAPIGHVTFCICERPWDNNLTRKLQLNKQSRSPEMNVDGRPFRLGKSILKDMRSLIIDDIVRGGADVSRAGRFYSHRKKKIQK